MLQSSIWCVMVHTFTSMNTHTHMLPMPTQIRSLLHACISSSICMHTHIDTFRHLHACTLLNLCTHRRRRAYSSHRSISFCKSMAPPRESVTHWPINWQSALIPSSSKELFFLVPSFCVSMVREPWASSTNKSLSHHYQNTLLLASHTFPTNQGPTYWPATQKGYFLTLTPLRLLL